LDPCGLPFCGTDSTYSYANFAIYKIVKSCDHALIERS